MPFNQRKAQFVGCVSVQLQLLVVVRYQSLLLLQPSEKSSSAPVSGSVICTLLGPYTVVSTYNSIQSECSVFEGSKELQRTQIVLLVADHLCFENVSGSSSYDFTGWIPICFVSSPISCGFAAILLSVTVLRFDEGLRRAFIYEASKSENPTLAYTPFSPIRTCFRKCSF